MTIDGLPHAGVGRYDDPNDCYDARLWFNPVPADPTHPFWRFGDGTYRYTWAVSDIEEAQGLASILVKGRDAAGNILTYTEARISDSYGKDVLIDVEDPTATADLFRATAVSISASAGAVSDNNLNSGYVDPASNSYVYIVVNGIIRDSSFTVTYRWEYEYDSLGTIVDSVSVPDTAWSYTETTTVLDTLWVNADGSVTERAEDLVAGTELQLNIYDLAGNTASVRVPVERHVDRFTYNLCAGWNMVSIPLVLENYTVGAVFPGVDGVYAYNVGTSSYIPLTSSDELENGVGYLVYSTTARTITIEGTALTSYEVTLYPGWNLIGATFSTVSFTSPATTPAGAIEPHTTYWFDCLGYVASDNLVPGRGYLVLVRQNATLEVPGTGKRVTPIFKSEVGSPEWMGNLNINSEAYSTTLRFGEAKNAKVSYDSNVDAVILPTIPGAVSAYFDQFMSTSVHGIANEINEWSLTITGGSTFTVEVTGLMEGVRAEIVSNNETIKLDGSVTLTAGSYKFVVYKSTIPKSYALYQNFPNPFNLGTTIRYALPEDANVTLSVYNLIGERVITLISGSEKAGYKKTFWNGCNESGRPVPSGVYFYKLDTKNFTTTSKMLLVK